ncbi:MAG: winged helix-turn-helix domain-containing protein [Chthoniobacteraceae bacterium]
MQARRKNAVPTISLEHARSIALNAQGLGYDPAPFGRGKEGVLRAIEHLGYVQVDTISVVQRAHHHVLWSRVPEYAPEHLHALQSADRTVFEYWSHAASYLPMRSFRFSRPLMESYRGGRVHWGDPSADLDRAMRRILRRLRRDGALQARDIAAEKTVSGGWGSFTKIERRALHELWMQGRVMIHSRAGFQKVFDLAERVLPAEVERRLPTVREAAHFRIHQALRAHGIVQEREISHLAGAESRREVRTALASLLRSREIVEIQVEGTAAKPCFAYPSALTGDLWGIPTRARILSPFDNLVIQRKRLLWLFDFDYQLECYVPAAKRRVGYFVLPILFGDSFIGRMDAVADRVAGILRIKTLIFEKGSASAYTRRDLEEEFRRFAAFNGCPALDLSPQAARTLKTAPSS